MSRLNFYESGDKLLSEKVNSDEKPKSGDKSSVNKAVLERLTNVFGSVVFKAQSNAGSAPSGGEVGNEAGNCFRIALLIDRIEKSFKPPSLDTSGEEAPLPSKPYAWFNFALSAADAQAALEGSASGTYFVMRNEDNLSEYKMYFVNTAGVVDSVSIVKTSNGCWKKENDQFSLFVSLRSLVEYLVSVGYVKNPLITNSSASNDLNLETGLSSSSSSSRAVAGDGSHSTKSGDSSTATKSGKKHHKHSHKHKTKKSKETGEKEEVEEEGEEEEQQPQIDPQDYNFDVGEVPPLGPLIKQH